MSGLLAAANMTTTILVRCLILWLALCSAAFAAGGSAAPSIGDPPLPVKDWQAIRHVVERQLKALKSGDASHALDYASPGIRAQFGTPENFLRMVRMSYAPLLEARHTQFLQGGVIDGTPFQPLRLVLRDNTVLVALYQMERQADGKWRIAGCALAPSTVVAT
jgi:hypothetical protein